jgi:solute carrier family 39 (zinc transporter), member 1/2/3
MAHKGNQTLNLALSLLLLLLLPSLSLATDCGVETEGTCHNKPKALRLKIIAIVTILVASVMGVSLPLITRSIPALHPDKNLFVVVKAFASGVILATGFMHVLPDSFHDLQSECLPEKPWHLFPFTAFIAMLFALLTLLVDSLMLTFFNRKKKGSSDMAVASSESPATVQIHGHGHCHGGAMEVVSHDIEENTKMTLRRNRVIAQVRTTVIN